MVLKRQMLAIQDVYVPVKRRQTLDPQKVDALAESMLAKGQKRPFLCGRMAAALSWLRGCTGSKPARPWGRQWSPPIWFKLASIDLRRECARARSENRRETMEDTDEEKREWHQKAFAKQWVAELSLGCPRRLRDDNHHVDPGASSLRRACECGR